MPHFSIQNKHRGLFPSRKCTVCGTYISSKNFSNRKPENKVCLCKKHLLANLLGEINPNFKHGKNAYNKPFDANLTAAFMQLRMDLAKVSGRIETQ